MRRPIWCREPDIADGRRQELQALIERYNGSDGLSRGPFDREELTRTDVEWLLADYMQNCGKGSNLNLSGAVLRRQDLSGLPLARCVDPTLPPPSLPTKAGTIVQTIVLLVGAELSGANLRGVDLRYADLRGVTFYDEECKDISLEDAYLSYAHLEQADLRGIHLRGARLSHAYMEGADLNGCRLQGALLSGAHLGPGANGQPADLAGAHLDEAVLIKADLWKANLEGASLREAVLEDACLMETVFRGTRMRGAQLRGARLQWARLERAQLQSAKLQYAHAENANFAEAMLQQADLTGARLHWANLVGTNLQRAILRDAHLEGRASSDEGWKEEREELRKRIPAVPDELPGADLQRAILDRGTALNNATLANDAGSVHLADVIWDDTNLAVVDWSALRKLGVGEEQKAKGYKASRPEPETAPAVYDAATPTGDQESREVSARTSAVAQENPVRKAIRTNYQLAVALRDRGLSADAADFALHARRLETKNLRTEGRLLQYLPQWLIGVTAGYGYSLWRAFVSYIVILVTFGGIYWLLGFANWGFNLGAPRQISIAEAVIVSAYAFHGRGLFSSSVTINSQICVGAVESAFGLLLEICFIAAFTQGFLSR